MSQIKKKHTAAKDITRPPRVITTAPVSYQKDHSRPFCSRLQAKPDCIPDTACPRATDGHRWRLRLNCLIEGHVGRHDLNLQKRRVLKQLTSKPHLTTTTTTTEISLYRGSPVP